MKKHTNNETYEPPKLEVIEILLEQAVLSMSGWGDDTDDSFDFGQRPDPYFEW